MRQGHSDTAFIISITYWRFHTGDDKIESKKCRVEGVSEGHQVHPLARSSTVTSTRSSQELFWSFLEKLEDTDSTSPPDNHGYPVL